jgi:Ca2+-binding RTX toxin-like protein
LSPGTYFVREVLLTGFTETTPPRNVTIVGDEEHNNENIGNITQGAALIPDPAVPGQTALLVMGTDGSDKITIKRDNKTGSIKVTMNGDDIGFFSPDGSIIVFGGEGNDSIKGNKSITNPMRVHGGDGADKVEGSGGDDILIGDAGEDKLSGKNGRDVLIGGLDEDKLDGGKGDDIVIGGNTDFDANDAALSSILAEWTSSRSYDTRVNNLRNGSGGGGVNDDIFLDSTTVHDDAIEDSLNGKGDLDWYLASTGDKVKGRKSNEFVDQI